MLVGKAVEKSIIILLSEYRNIIYYRQFIVNKNFSFLFFSD